MKLDDGWLIAELFIEGFVFVSWWSLVTIAPPPSRTRSSAASSGLSGCIATSFDITSLETSIPYTGLDTITHFSRYTRSHDLILLARGF